MDMRHLRGKTATNLAALNELRVSSVQGILDVDGVFSAPHRDSAEASPAVVGQLVHLLKRGFVAALATGRPGVWIAKDDGVLGIARTMLKNDSVAWTRLKATPHFAENGAVVVTLGDTHYTEAVVDTTLKFPIGFKKLATTLVDDLKIGHFAEVDPAKSCVLSVYVHAAGFGQKHLEPHKPAIVAAFDQFIKDNQMDWVVAQTAIAVDAYHRSVSKELAVDGFVRAMQKTSGDLGIVAVGDSPSDFALFVGLNKARTEERIPKSTKLWFVFTGTEDGLTAIQNRYQIDLRTSSEFIYAGVVGKSKGLQQSEPLLYSDATERFLSRLIR